jgi:transposase-like protein
VFPKIRKDIWTNEALEETMDVIERRTHSIWRVSKSWNIDN